jgi:hypothetical protein
MRPNRVDLFGYTTRVKKKKKQIHKMVYTAKKIGTTTFDGGQQRSQKLVAYAISAISVLSILAKREESCM